MLHLICRGYALGLVDRADESIRVASLIEHQEHSGAPACMALIDRAWHRACEATVHLIDIVSTLLDRYDRDHALIRPFIPVFHSRSETSYAFPPCITYATCTEQLPQHEALGYRPTLESHLYTKRF